MEYRDYKNKKQLQKGSLDRTFSFEKKIKEEDEKINLLKNELAKIDVPTATRKVKKRKVFSLIICLIALLSSIPLTFTLFTWNEVTIKKHPAIYKTETYTESGNTVYITDTEECYHADGCHYLDDSQYAISLSDAIWGISEIVFLNHGIFRSHC